MYASLFQINNDKYNLYEDKYMSNKNNNQEMLFSRVGLNKKMDNNSSKQKDSYNESLIILNSSESQIKDSIKNISL